MKRTRTGIIGKGTMLFTILVATILGLSFLTVQMSADDVPSWADGYSEQSFEMVDPEDYQDLVYDDINDVEDEINGQISNMTYGDVQTLNTSTRYYTYFLIEDHSCGNVIYWEVSDGFTHVRLDAYSGEIIEYFNGRYEIGVLNQNEASILATNIANQFCNLPNDRSSQDIEQSDVGNIYRFDPEDPLEPNNTTTETFGYWMVWWNRTKNNVITEDNIQICIGSEGTLSFYGKTWWMNLTSISTNPVVTQSEAETAALNIVDNTTVICSYTKIVRPNDMFGEVVSHAFIYGTDPLLVWVVVLDYNNTEPDGAFVVITSRD